MFHFMVCKCTASSVCSPRCVLIFMFWLHLNVRHDVYYTEQSADRVKRTQRAGVLSLPEPPDDFPVVLVAAVLAVSLTS